MTRHHKRAARRERQAAKALGTERVHRAIGESAADALPATLPSGVVVQIEAKERAKPLATAERWLAQAESYCTPDAVPVLLVYATGQHAEEALVIFRVRDFKRIAGLTQPDAQQALPFAGVNHG